ncbi:MAG: ABC transporter ATP-binding protein [Chitinophagaceae bacterium]
MQIELQNIGKKYNKDWIFRNLNYEFKSGNSYAVTGHNGSGKSTLLQIISGFVLPTEGQAFCDEFHSNILYQQIAIAAPYLELIEEMTAIEFLQFHQHFKSFIGNISMPQILEEVQLSQAANKQIRYFSSGMKQRLKLAQAFFSNTKVLLLDEPTSNLDKQGINLYLQLIKQYSNDRLVIICSNDENEYSFCNQKLEIGK